MEYALQLSVDERVCLTALGSSAHREHHFQEKVVISVVGSVAPIPNQIKDAAFGVSETAYPVEGATGTIIEKRRRWWGKGGYDYKVAWDPQAGGGASWHLSKHLEKLTQD